MRKHFFLLLCLFGVASAYGQSSDFLILKKRGKPLQYFYKGSHIEFVTKTGAYRNALITDIKNDSIYLQEFLVRRIPTTFGAIVTDTAGSFRYQYHYMDAASFGMPHKGFDLGGAGSVLMSGGLLLTVGSGIAYLVDKDKFSPELLGAAIGLGALGYVVNRLASKPVTIGKKYSLEYIPVQGVH